MKLTVFRVFCNVLEAMSQLCIYLIEGRFMTIKNSGNLHHVRFCKKAEIDKK